MKDLWRIGGVLLLVQALLIGIYLHFESERSSEEDSQTKLGTAAPTQIEGAFPPLIAERRDGTGVSVDPARPTLIHLWATWCPPCRKELPGLLALDGDRLQVIAIAMDPNWQALDKFFEGRVPPQVVRGDANVLNAQLSIQTLPVTFLVDGTNAHALRFDGARDWGAQSFRKLWFATN